MWVLFFRSLFKRSLNQFLLAEQERHKIQMMSQLRNALKDDAVQKYGNHGVDFPFSPLP